MKLCAIFNKTVCCLQYKNPFITIDTLNEYLIYLQDV